MLSNLSTQLSTAKRRAQMSGRTLSRQESSGIAEGVAAGASERLYKGNVIRLQEEAGERTERLHGETLAHEKGMHERGITSTEKIAGEGLTSAEKIAGEGLTSAEKIASDKLTSAEKMHAEGLISDETLQDARLEAQRTESGLQRTHEETLQTTQITSTEAMHATEQKDTLEMFYRQIQQNLHIAKMQKKVAEGAGGGGCFGKIVTACTGNGSYEVQVIRHYRDRLMTDKELGGYYALCNYVVPVVKKYRPVNRWVKRFLIDRLINWYENYLRFHNNKLVGSKFVKISFLKLCDLIGSRIDIKSLIDKHRR